MDLATKAFLEVEEQLPRDLSARLKASSDTVVFDASSGGILEVLKSQGVNPPRSLMMCDETVGAANRWAAGASGKTGSPAELSTFIQLRDLKLTTSRHAAAFAWSRVDKVSYAFLSSSRQQRPTWKLT